MAADFLSVYPYSLEEAKRLKEVSLWRKSHKENVACKEAIREAICRDFDGKYLKAECAERVIELYGFRRVRWVLANTVQHKDHDGRFSRENKLWAEVVFIPENKNHLGNLNNNMEFVVDSHPAVLDGFINQYRCVYQGLGLFEHIHCEPDSKNLDYTGKVLVISLDILKESYWSQQNQLWLATGGFGCHPDSSGRAVFSICLSDGENTRWNRSDFVGILKEEFLPDWAKEKLVEYQTQKQESSGIGGLEIK
ncbi:DUF3849 domain-containing protein [Lacrimispora sp.]|uniref:DUF3849 domain-containing protein n=1 Tax=Lacrimispora sp. TaxID=2719234 RepID=UPI0028B0FBE3|nr:DUF3849 domain-containing protein [Lacrimispora sp.]